MYVAPPEVSIRGSEVCAQSWMRQLVAGGPFARGGRGPRNGRAPASRSNRRC